MSRIVRAIPAASVLLLAATVAMGQDTWPQFRGGSASGVAVHAKLPASWSKSENVVWKREIPGKGWSSPIVWRDRVIVTTAVGPQAATAPRKGLYALGIIGQPGQGEHQWKVYCLAWPDGKILWEKTAHQGVPKIPIHGKNSYATETPVTDGEVIVARFGAAGLFAYDMQGRELWSHQWEPSPMRMGWGTASSPVLHQDRVYVLNDNEASSFLAAFDKRTGKQVWRTPRDEKSNWSTPLVWKNSRRTEIVTVASGKVRSYDLDGRLLWELSDLTSIHIPTPVAAKDLLYVASGYVTDQFRPVYAIRPGAKGDISLKGSAAANEFVAWSLATGAPYNPSPLVYGDYLYVLLDRGAMACYEARSGKEIYSRQRLSPDLATFAASPWACDGKIYCLSEDAETFVVQAGPEFKVLARHRLDDTALATPAVAHDSLVIRTLSSVYRIGTPSSGR